MIQRIQSVWFLLASACAFLSLTMPFYIGTTVDGKKLHQLNGMENLYFTVLTCLIGLISFITIFLFKKRRRQVRLAVVGIMFEIVLILLYSLQVREFIEGTYALSALLQGCVLFFFFLALRGISKDIKIIRSSDRLR